MALLDSFKALKADFIYTSEEIDYWKLWPKEGLIKDDCDGFSLNLVLRHFGSFWKPILTGKAKLYHCKYYGVGHMVVKIEGQYCDNITGTPFVRIPVGYTGFKEYGPLTVLGGFFGFKSKWRYRLLKWVDGLK